MRFTIVACCLVLASVLLLACSDDGQGPKPDTAGNLDHSVADQSASDKGSDTSKAEGGTSEASANPQCLAAGGSCTQYRFILCPKGKEPVDPNPHQDCDNEGWCCVAAPSSTCSDQAPTVNCIAGTRCEGCWAPARNRSFTCEQGRVCCMDTCE